jgi:outer membrane protein OmpA-like peptidoglycan-associated protein
MLNLCMAIVLNLFACSGEPEKPTPVDPEPVAEHPDPAPAPNPDPAPAADPGREFETGPVIRPVNFESGSAEVTADEEARIERAAKIAKDGDWRVLLVGLADESGDAATNKALTEKRIAAVASELEERGVPGARISRHALGERLATDVNNVRQRKVEFVFYKAAGDLTPNEIVKRSRVLESDFHDRDEDREDKDGKQDKDKGKDGKNKDH